jgi:threonine/homoserine/homoserine lactone efflux protein
MQFVVFFAAAFVLAVTPGPGIFYVAARTLAGGRAEGIASTFGTGLGGMTPTEVPIFSSHRSTFDRSHHPY